jgi:OmpA-OmpF porin, OOP family
MKTKLTIATTICLFSTLAHSEVPGFYVNMQLGSAKTRLQHAMNIPPEQADILPSIDDDQFAYRLGFGYQLDQNRSIEIGYRDFGKHSAKYDVPMGDPLISQHENESAFDVSGKWSMVLSPRFNGYVKGGAALVKTNTYIEVNGKRFIDDTQSKVQPVFGLGLSYAITPEWPIDLSWSRIQHVGSDAAPSSDFYSIGISYYFG